MIRDAMLKMLIGVFSCHQKVIGILPLVLLMLLSRI
jgi:hypothetical protein